MGKQTIRKSKEASRHIEAVICALVILDCFRYNSYLTIKDVIDQTGLIRSRAMRLIGTLESRGYIISDPDKKMYYPGLRLSILSRSFDAKNHTDVLVRPILHELAEETGESATYYVRDGIDRVALVRVEGSYAVRYSIREGQSCLLSRGGAAAKVLMAFGPPGILCRVFSSTELETGRWARKMQKIREDGYAISRSENTPGASSISAPVFNGHNGLVGAMTISGPSSRLEDHVIKQYLEIVDNAAKIISRRFDQLVSDEV